ncbi:MAG: transposase [Bacilli bacterium]|nr:transposase [Bacilli bacterium]
MANKGQKFKKYSPKIKEKILKEYFNEGAGRDFLGRKYGISRGTISNWIYDSKKGIDVKIDHRAGRSGRPKTKSLTLEDYKERYEILKKYQAFLQARRGKK